MKLKAIIILIIVGLIALFSSAYVVDETEQVIITQFGEVIGDPKTEPGLKFKIPLIQQVNRFRNNLLEWDGDPGQIPTLDKTFIRVDTFARWKIVDSLKFFQTVTNEIGAYSRLDDIIDSAVRNLITSYSLIETVRKSRCSVMKRLAAILVAAEDSGMNIYPAFCGFPADINFEVQHIGCRSGDYVYGIEQCRNVFGVDIHGFNQKSQIGGIHQRICFTAVIDHNVN